MPDTNSEERCQYSDDGAHNLLEDIAYLGADNVDFEVYRFCINGDCTYEESEYV